MSKEQKHAIVPASGNSSAFNPNAQGLLGRLPILSVATTGWELATHAFAEDRIKYRKDQQWKSFFCALCNPKFASVWFYILRSPELYPVVTHRQRLYLKPFRAYMSIKWTKIQKVKVILDTYRFMASKGNGFMQAITSCSGVEIARIKLNETTDGVLMLGYDQRYRKEGELVLSFNCDRLGGVIAAAAFSFEEIKSEQWICRIACIQGHQLNAENSSKEVQKLLHGLRPKSLLVLTIQEFSRHLGLSAIYGAGDKIQAYHRKHFVHLPWRHSIQFDYDTLWRESGGKPVCDGWYELPLIPLRKSNSEIKSHKRSLYNKRYCMLDHLSLEIGDTVRRLSKEGVSPPHVFLTSL